MTIQVSTTDARLAKALALLSGADRWLKIRRKSDGRKFYVIPGSNGKLYWTNLQECSCPDRQQRRVYCKHMLAAAFHVAQVLGDEARRALEPVAPKPVPTTPLGWYDGTAAIGTLADVATEMRREAV